MAGFRIGRPWIVHTLAAVLVGLAGVVASGSPATAQTRSVQAGPIWSNMDAQGKCPGVCRQAGASRWNGNWRTTQVGRMSECDCVFAGGGGGSGQPGISTFQDVNAGPIWNDMDADRKCPGVCRQAGASRWTGQWHTTVPGQMSVCNCRFGN